MQRWIFETPWWMLIAIAAAAVGLLVSGNNRQDRQLKWTGLGILAAGLGLWLVSWLVETPREIAIRQTRQAIAAVLAKDRSTLDGLLHARAALLGWGKEQILDGAVEYHERFGLQSAYVTSIDGSPVDSIVTVTVSVLSRHDGRRTMIDTIPSTWELKWQDTTAGWRLKEIVPIRIGQTDRSQLPGGLFGR